MITNEVVGGDHRGDLLVVPHVDGVDVGVAVEATGDEVDGDVLHLVSSLFDGSVLGCCVVITSSPSCSVGHSASSSITSSGHIPESGDLGIRRADPAMGSLVGAG